jgi:hypothetical protein
MSRLAAAWVPSGKGQSAGPHDALSVIFLNHGRERKWRALTQRLRHVLLWHTKVFSEVVEPDSTGALVGHDSHPAMRQSRTLARILAGGLLDRLRRVKELSNSLAVAAASRATSLGLCTLIRRGPSGAPGSSLRGGERLNLVEAVW